MNPLYLAAQDGPTLPPADPADWPGKGVAGLFDLWTERRAEFWQARQKDQGAVVFFGDSITHRWDVAAAFPEMKVANRGIGGDSSRRCVFRVQEDVLDLAPRAIVIMIGINDLNNRVPPADVADNIRLMLDQIRARRADTPVVLCHVTPWDHQPGKFPESILAVNTLIDRLAAGRPHVAVCDTWPGIATPEGTSIPECFEDGVHPNALGYERLEANLRPVLRRLNLL